MVLLEVHWKCSLDPAEAGTCVSAMDWAYCCSRFERSQDGVRLCMEKRCSGRLALPKVCGSNYGSNANFASLAARPHKPSPRFVPQRNFPQYCRQWECQSASLVSHTFSRSCQKAVAVAVMTHQIARWFDPGSYPCKEELHTLFCRQAARRLRRARLSSIEARNCVTSLHIFWPAIMTKLNWSPSLVSKHCPAESLPVLLSSTTPSPGVHGIECSKHHI